MNADLTTCVGEQRQNVLIVEDSKTFGSLLSRAVQSGLGIEARITPSFADTKKHLSFCAGDYFAALLDLNLPDAPRGEIVDLVVKHGIPAVVFTGEMSDDIRDLMWSKHIVDYVLKDNRENIQQVVAILKRLRQNMGKKALVVDDSAVSRAVIRGLLEVWNFTVLEATDGRTALEILEREKDPKVCLMITDYNMPGMDGAALVREVRRTLSKSRLPIIGLSGAGGATTSAHFIKAGANDYMHKPFLTEEFYCRVLSNIETSDYIATIRDLAERDSLTGAFNRRSFFSYGQKLLAGHRRRGKGLVLAMLDIDHFKRCNDRYGHAAGDLVISAVARYLSARFRESDMVARMGGEEFAVICADMDPDRCAEVFDEVRQGIEGTVVSYEGQDIRVTMSIGVCARQDESLEEMLKRADRMLYEAKDGGRNRIQIDR
ncbi:MAG: diguanylate cyclase [Deltaproteobacteria bacterium]|nr:diguanylate cyclase [Deltaproteobacteria bacterium]